MVIQNQDGWNFHVLYASLQFEKWDQIWPSQNSEGEMPRGYLSKQ